MKILITGGTNGMGKGVAKILPGADGQLHEIIIVCRNKKLAEDVVTELQNTTGNKKISYVLCDLARLSDVKNAIREIQSVHDYLDGVFINAGLGYAPERVETVDGMDSHFQVNYLSQFVLTLNLLDLLEKSENGGRVIFNATHMGEMFWDDMQMRNKWGYEAAIHQAMVAKRMFLVKLHHLHRAKKDSNLSFVGFQIHKVVWSNQLNIIPFFMKAMASTMRLFGTFISIEKCGEIMAPLFTEPQSASLEKSGKLLSWKKGEFIELDEIPDVLDHESQDRLWQISLDLCDDEKTRQIAMELNT